MRRMIFHFWLITAAFLLAPGPMSHGKVIYVDEDAPARGDGRSWTTAYRFLQDALADAQASQETVEVRVARGIYKPDREWHAPEGTGDIGATFDLADDVSLLGGYAGLGADDPDARNFDVYETILSGDLAGNDVEITDAALLRKEPTRDENSGYVVVIHRARVRLEGVTITGGTSGGAYLTIYPWGGATDVTVSDCQFYGNRGSEGDAPTAGALTASQGSPKLTVVRCSFVANAGCPGGAVNLRDVVLRHCRFERNYCWGDHGGAGVVAGNSAITDCIFTGNRAERAAGALHLRSSGSDISRVFRCRFYSNSAGEWGGGAVCDGNADIRECVFVANRAGMRGGAGCDQGSGTVRLSNCLLAGNRAGERGGAWGSYARSTLGIFACTAVENYAPEGLFLETVYNIEKNPNHVTVRNCVLANGDDEIWSDATPVQVAYTCIGAEGRLSAEPSDWLVLGEGNVETDPLLVDSGYWDPNGTPDDPNDDFFVEGYCHLKSQAGRWDPTSGSWIQDDVTSPCIDAGDPNSPIMHEPFPNGGVINMGAYGGTEEASKSYFGESPCETIIAGDINGDCRVDLADIAILLDHWLQTGRKATE